MDRLPPVFTPDVPVGRESLSSKTDGSSLSAASFERPDEGPRIAHCESVTTLQAGTDSLSSGSPVLPEHPIAVADNSVGPRLDNYEPQQSLTASASVQERLALLPDISATDLHMVQLPLAVERQARDLLVRARELADRGALYAARDEFARIMRLITQALDANLGRPLHTPALAMGLRALDEANDFVISGRYVESDIQMEGLIASHQTPVLQNTNLAEWTPLMAIQKYYEYAYKHLALAGNRQSVASETLFALGRIEMMLAESRPDSTTGAPKAIAFFNAALTVDAANSRAANELGVLLARRGRLEEAQDVFAHAAQTAPTAIVLRNLGDVQFRLGQSQMAMQTMQRAAQTAAITQQPTTQEELLAQRVQMVDPATFNRLSQAPSSVFANGAMNAANAVTPIPSQPQGLTPKREMPATTTRTAAPVGWFGF